MVLAQKHWVSGLGRVLEVAGQSPSPGRCRDRADAQCRGVAGTEVSGRGLDSVIISEVFASLIDSVVL